MKSVDDKILNIIGNALRQKPELPSINNLLHDIVEIFNANGAILWEINPKSKRLLTIAQWFEGNQKHVIHSVPIEGSVTGKAINEMQMNYVPNIDRNKQVYRNASFWKEFEIKSFLVIPIKFKDNNPGSLNIYSSKTNPFSKDKRKQLEILALLLPDLFESLRDRVTFHLITTIDERLREAQKNSNRSRNKLKKIFSYICKEIQQTFQCFEISIFLEDPFKKTSEYERIASTWNKQKGKKSYRRSQKAGLTGWILYNKKSVIIPDLLQFSEQYEMIQKEYPGIRWLDRAKIKSSIRGALNLQQGTETHPLSFLGVPILVGEKTYGVIRCCAALQSPYYFGVQELKMLELVATRIGHSWKNWIQQRLIDEESRSWREVVKSTSSLDLSILNELESDNPNQNSIFDKVFVSLAKAIPGADIMDVRILDKNKKELYFASTYGDAWNMGSKEDIRARKERRFSVNNQDSISAGAKVYNSRETLVLDPIKRDDPYDGTFKETKKIIVAPLLEGNNVLGVLDIRSTKKNRFPLPARPVTELMARQLAIYYHLIATIIELRNLKDQQVQTFQDLSHQFKGPINQATSRARIAIADAKRTESEKMLKNLYRVSGLCNKANRVAKNIRLFSHLAKNIPLQINFSPVIASQIVKLSIETASDNLVMINPLRNIRINVDKESFNFLDGYILELDIEMLEQALNALLDNATKYCYSNSKININGSLTRRGHFQIIVSNKGIPINSNEISFCSQRSWRGEYAKITTGEGEGIGLWVVDHIMKAHGGNLVVLPTSQEGVTEIKLVFPIRKIRK